ncbi:hypothetical protein FACS189487_09750 [Campylobacterota bacterium]|nr:hypothetical protein FACS189487_09750 [Campylobacterota bacterium]
MAWKVTGGADHSSNFAAATSYTATVTLTAKAGFTFTGVGANTFTYTGANSVTNDADSGIITIVFPPTFTAAPDLALSQVTDSNSLAYTITASDPAADSYTIWYIQGIETDTATIKASGASVAVSGTTGTITGLSWGETYSAFVEADKTGYTTSGSSVKQQTTVNPVPTSIAISGTPTKTVYGIGEDFDPTGLTLTVNYSDLTSSTPTITAAMLDSTWNTTYGTGKSITVTHSPGITATITGITVQNLVQRVSAAAGTTATITLYADETITASAGQMSLTTANTHITLTGNGARTITDNSGRNSLFRIDSGTSLTLGTGTTDTNTITITGKYAYSGSGTNGGTVYVDGGTFTMNAGAITSNRTQASGGMNGNNGGGVYVASGSFVMNGGEITYNSIANGWVCGYSGGSRGGGVYVYDGVFTFNSGTINNNISYSGIDKCGHQVYKEIAGTVNTATGTIPAVTDEDIISGAVWWDTWN